MNLKRLLFLLLLPSLPFLLAGGPTPPSVVTGVVTDSCDRPVPAARVRYQATPISTSTDSTGAFELPMAGSTRSRFITAWKEGYLNGGERRVEGKTNYRIVLKPLPPSDHPEYHFAFSRRSETLQHDRKTCDTCHADIVDEWERSAHAGAATNPLFLAVFTGKHKGGQITGGPGYVLDFPGSTGNCATCHIPAAALTNPFGTDPMASEGVALEGVFCDFCHKIRDARVDPTGGRPGVLSYSFLRPAHGEDVFFGQLDDVIAGPDAYHPLYQDSRYCAPCHHGTFWDVLAYSEFAEWAASSYAKRNIHCQDCHMKPAAGPRRFAPEQEGGVVRDPATLSSHVQFGLNDDAFMRGTVALNSRAHVAGDHLHVHVSIENVGGGHHMPTGSPMRNMILLVQALDASGRVLPLIEGDRVPDWAGTGSPEQGGYAGLPGRGFAKILVDLVEYPADPRMGRQFSRVYPAPYWRPTVLASDNRIPAEATDRSTYIFGLPEKGGGPYRVRTRLIYRRTFKTWGELLTIKNDELELGSTDEHFEDSLNPERVVAR